MFFKNLNSWMVRSLLILAIACGGLGVFSLSAIPASAADGWTNVGPAGFSTSGTNDITLAFNGDTPYVAYSDDALSFGVTVMKYNGNGWEAVGTPGFPGTWASSYISLAFNGNVPYVAYRDGANGSRATVMKYNGSDWVTVGAPGISAWHAFYTRITFSDGIPYIAYQDGANGFKATVMKYNGSSWEPVGTPGFSAGMADYISFAFNGGIPYVAFMDNQGPKATVMKFNGSSWEVVGTRAFADGCWHLVFNADIPYVACSYSSAESRLMKYNGHSWETVGTPGFADIAAGFMSLAFSDGIPYVAYNDGSHGGKVTVKRYNGSTWEVVGTPGFSIGKTTHNLSFAMNGGTPYVAYQDDENGKKATVMKYVNLEQIVYVNGNATGANDGSSWADAYTNLQSALAAASSGDDVWVAAGTYKPTTGTDRIVSFDIKNGLAIYGGFAGGEALLNERNPAANPTILSGDIGIVADSSDNSYHVVTISSVDNTVVLDGFTITAGNANGDSNESIGGGMFNDRGSPSLTNITFADNNAAMNGGGMYSGAHTSPSLKNVAFVDNTAYNGGGVYNGNSATPSLTNVIFSNNTAYHGGGVYNYNAAPSLMEVTFSGNTADYGGGIYDDSFSASPLLMNVTFSGNTANYGGGIANYGANPSLTNVTFSANAANSDGGGIYNSSMGSPSLTNVTFSGNTANQWGGGMYNSGVSSTSLINVTLSGNTASSGAGIYNLGDLVITNSILYGNTNGEISIGGGGAPIVTYSIVQGGHTGTGNLDADPLLGPLQDNGGFTQTMALLSDSPAIDAGDDANCPDVDQRGMARPQGSHCDMGAYEYDGSIVIPTLTPTATATFTPTSTDTPTATATRTPTMGPVAKPGIPALVSPANGALAGSLRPVLDWKNSNPTAHHYQVQISTNSGFSSLVINESNVIASDFTLTFDLIPGKLYYWRVKAFNVNGVSSAWSTVRNFKTTLAQPVLLSPTENEPLFTDRPTFEWDSVYGATSYVLQASRVENFSTLLLNITLNKTHYTMLKDLPQNKTLYWRVRATTPAVTGPWSAKWTFKTGNPPSVPMLATPANGFLVKDYAPLFNWSNATVPTGTTFKHYELQADEDADFSSLVVSATTTASQFTPISELASNSKFYWRVRAVNTMNSVDHVSSWSPVWSFRTRISVPNSLMVVSNGSEPLKPSFEWDDAAGPGAITGYTIQISTNASFGTFLVNTTTQQSMYVPTKNLPMGKTIYWRVRVNGANGPSSWAVGQFNTF